MPDNSVAAPRFFEVGGPPRRQTESPVFGCPHGKSINEQAYRSRCCLAISPAKNPGYPEGLIYGCHSYCRINESSHSLPHRKEMVEARWVHDSIFRKRPEGGESSSSDRERRRFRRYHSALSAVASQSRLGRSVRERLLVEDRHSLCRLPGRGLP